MSRRVETPPGVAELVLAGEVTSAAFYAAVDSADRDDRAEVLALAQHEDPEVRRSVASTLPLLMHGDPPTDAMVETVVRLTLDPDPRVRDHACFALGEQWRDVDTPALRDALAARLDDLDRDTRSEALVGLAYRRDVRALPRVREALSRPSGQVWRLEMVAAGALADPDLHVLTVRHRHGWDDPSDAVTVDAVCRLTDPAGPGEDLIDGVARLYRRRARGLPDGRAQRWWRLMDAMLDIAPHRAPAVLEAVLHRVADDPAAVRLVRAPSALAVLAAEQQPG